MDLQPLGDQAVMAYSRDERTALIWASRVRKQNFSWLVDVVQAYTSVAVFYNLDKIDYYEASHELAKISDEISDDIETIGQLHEIPCCYEMGLDLDNIAEVTGLDREEIIRLHSGQVYTVYAIGFCPGFPYMGYLPEPLAAVSRLTKPRLKVKAGSVAITGKQTGIYTEAKPGGWNIIGRTPIKLVDVAKGFFPLQTGDRVQFTRIDNKEFEELKKNYG